ncbi:Dual specificity tyrosine-phosphorylation-regulated kinase 3 [Orchesella cincta]|uniref:dual-specificity kinase n=1 Tax=Orchesella cincta TaxID=48709 RepID=A0A1D2MBC4_ORCCI|nr:Dual specificity tyrosine-phosphorylation-regulated kinase 3 [Orchesella cincta]
MSENLSKKMDVSQKVKEPAEPSTSETEGSKTGMSLQEAFDKYGFKLSSFETREIFRYSQIYFVGEKATKINGGIDLRDTSRFDDEYGFYRFVPEDHLAYRYELVKPLGKGTTAQVFSAVDHKENHGNIDVVQMYDHFRNHACIVFELLSENPWSVIKETKKQGLPLHRVQGFACSLIKVLDALGRNKIMHGDLKLDNILVKQTGAPLSSTRSDPRHDDESDQLALGMEVFGVPPPEFLELCSRAKNFIKDGEPCFAIARLTPSQALVHPFITNKIPSPGDNEKSSFSPAAEDSQPNSARSRGTYKERRVTNKRKRSELED